TPEGFVPGSKSNTGMPWMVIYPLARGFSFDPDASQYKGAQWIIKNIVDTSAKGGSFQVGVGPDGAGRFHPTAIQQLKEAGKWLKVCARGIDTAAAYFEPFTRLFQLLNGGGMETAGAIGADADLETTALCGCIHDVFDDPLRAFVLRCIWIKRKAARQRINDHPGHACIRFTTRNETFRRIVISVIANAARADHDIWLKLADAQHSFAELRPDTRPQPLIQRKHVDFAVVGQQFLDLGPMSMQHPIHFRFAGIGRYPDQFAERFLRLFRLRVILRGRGNLNWMIGIGAKIGVIPVGM